MSVKKIISKLDLSTERDDLSYIKKETGRIVLALKKAAAKGKIAAEVFLGGSFAKDTLVRKDLYDIDIFVRFDWRYDDLSGPLEKLIKKALPKAKVEKVHGSRDYFRVASNKKVVFEIVPVTKIRNPKEARNVTDLSYFHVNYIKRKIRGTKLADQIRAAKMFCKAQGVYGAESYIQGFSGYGLECLIIHYKAFEKMLKVLSTAKERLVIDPEKKYKNKSDVLFSLNEAKLHSPIVLVDPTWKERNVLAALSKDTFRKFQDSAKKFLKKPSEKFFETKEIDERSLEREAKSKKAEIVKIKMKTGRQAGDIAGTKMKKFSNFLIRGLSKYFEIKKKEFVYNKGQEGTAYIIAKSKGEIIRPGPPVKLKESAAAFKKKNKRVFEENGILHIKIKVNFTAKEFIQKWVKDYKGKMKEMSISGLKVF